MGIQAFKSHAESPNTQVSDLQFKSKIRILFFSSKRKALVAQWVGHWPVNLFVFVFDYGLFSGWTPVFEFALERSPYVQDGSCRMVDKYLQAYSHCAKTLIWIWALAGQWQSQCFRSCNTAPQSLQLAS